MRDYLATPLPVLPAMQLLRTGMKKFSTAALFPLPFYHATVSGGGLVRNEQFPFCKGGKISSSARNIWQFPRLSSSSFEALWSRQSYLEKKRRKIAAVRISRDGANAKVGCHTLLSSAWEISWNTTTTTAQPTRKPSSKTWPGPSRRRRRRRFRTQLGANASSLHVSSKGQPGGS